MLWSFISREQPVKQQLAFDRTERRLSEKNDVMK
jgi:hypothetical protein